MLRAVPGAVPDATPTAWPCRKTETGRRKRTSVRKNAPVGANCASKLPPPLPCHSTSGGRHPRARWPRRIMRAGSRVTTTASSRMLALLSGSGRPRHSCGALGRPQSCSIGGPANDGLGIGRILPPAPENRSENAPTILCSGIVGVCFQLACCGPSGESTGEHLFAHFSRRPARAMGAGFSACFVNISEGRDSQGCCG